ncbi:hypothetical protein [Actinospica robiniae]|uniref:tRNA adenosine deaminase-associated protein n=1 Tax=Actinospica robiniae TaxID=304901 RepID=UPI00041BE183|nr:hypothetical protein [Actinospica robiniae]
MAYFAALLARYADEWQARDVDLDEVDDGMGLVEFIREAAEDEEPDTAVLLLEQEDVWFALVRLDIDEDPRVFAGDLAAVRRSGYADLLTADSLPPLAPDGTPLEPVPHAEAEADDEDDDEDAEVDLDGAEELDEVAVDEEEYTGPAAPSGPAGDANLLADFGLSAKDLIALCGGRLVPADALAEIAGVLGAAEELEAVR